MYLEVLHDNSTSSKYDLKKEDFYDAKLRNHLGYIGSSKKETNALNIIQAYYSDSKAILFDHTNKLIVQKLQALSIPPFKETSSCQTLFDNQDFSLMFFTSGSTGNPVGALKKKHHLEEEIKVLSKLFEPYNIKKVIVTVPFIHIYGTLMGLLYPLFNNIPIVLKEHFLPYDLLNLIDDNTLIVTTPLYIQALNKISNGKNLNHSIFVSSTAPLAHQEAKLFSEKFQTKVFQLFGSTETGGIAYKLNDEILWTPLQKVTISVNENKELKVTSPFVSDILYENEFRSINGQLQTFDYIEQLKHQFKLIGRSSQILKIAGKRYSTIQIEDILERQEGITKAMVFVNDTQNSHSLRTESLNITLESFKSYSTKEIKKILQENLSNLKFSICLKIVDKIPTSSVGKKLKI